MYIINETYFQAPKREIPNLDEADSKSFVELERLIDEYCRLFMYCFLTPEEITDFDSYLVNGIFPTDTSGIPQKWIDLVNGKDSWVGLIQEKGTSNNSLLADFVYSKWLETQASYMNGLGDSKGNPKGSSLVNPTQRIVNVWNEFVEKYDSLLKFISENPEDYTSESLQLFELRNQLGL